MTVTTYPPGARPHRLSVDFAWRPLEGPFRLLTEAQAHQFDEQGFILLDRAVPTGEVEALVAEIDPMEAELNEVLRGAEDGRIFIARADEITFTTHLVTRSDRARRFVSGPPFLDLVHDLIGPDVRFYWDQSVYKRPGADDPFPWHQDNGYAFVVPQQYLTCWVALTDTDESNGCPWVVPGLHRLGTLAHRDTPIGLTCFDAPPGATPDRPYGDALAVPARAGSIVVFSSLTPHATGPNRTDSIRKSYIVQYAPTGAAVIGVDAAGNRTETPADHPDRQFPILAGGAPVV